jgi:hypothetical protein
VTLPPHNTSTLKSKNKNKASDPIQKIMTKDTFVLYKKDRLKKVAYITLTSSLEELSSS